jgi:hypothetical protein
MPVTLVRPRLFFRGQLHPRVQNAARFQRAHAEQHISDALWVGCVHRRVKANLQTLRTRARFAAAFSSEAQNPQLCPNQAIQGVAGVLLDQEEVV